MGLLAQIKERIHPTLKMKYTLDYTMMGIHIKAYKKAYLDRIIITPLGLYALYDFVFHQNKISSNPLSDKIGKLLDGGVLPIGLIMDTGSIIELTIFCMSCVLDDMRGIKRRIGVYYREVQEK